MKTITIQQELLLMTGTTFANQGRASQQSVPASNETRQKLIEQLYGGMLPILLPEIFYNIQEESRLYVWLVRHGHSFIQLELCEDPLVIDVAYSIDPYLYLSGVHYS